jgi:hypothetical protein
MVVRVLCAAAAVVDRQVVLTTTKFDRLARNMAEAIIRGHIRLDGHYSFHPPDLGGVSVSRRWFLVRAEPASCIRDHRVVC